MRTLVSPKRDAYSAHMSEPNEPKYAWAILPVLVLCALSGLTGCTSARAVEPTKRTETAKATDPAKKLSKKSKHACSTHGHHRCRALVRLNEAGAAFAVGGPIVGGTDQGLTAKQIEAAYSIPPGGANVTVAVVVAYDDPTAETDLAEYRRTSALPACTSATGCFQKVSGQGGPLPPPPPEADDWNIETSLDLDAVSAACPSCKLLLVEAKDDLPDEFLYEAVNVAAHGAQVVSASWGSDEMPTGAAQWNFDTKYMSHPGVSMFFASGDEGYGASYPAASPNVWAVGGTTLTFADGRATETVWNDGANATGAGCSKWEPRPDWQSPASGCSSRLTNDIAADADPMSGLRVYCAGNWMVVGGTSLATPLMAGMFAAMGLAGQGPSYAYKHAPMFSDVDAGNDVLPGGAAGCAAPNVMCTAHPGYDGPSGMGAPRGR